MREVWRDAPNLGVYAPVTVTEIYASWAFAINRFD